MLSGLLRIKGDCRYRAACIKWSINIMFLNQPFIPAQQGLNKGRGHILKVKEFGRYTGD